MSNLIAIVGPPGSGKSTSLRNLNPSETVIINVSGKSLPFKGWKSKYTAGKVSEGANYICTSEADNIVAVLSHINDNRPEIKNIVVDDAGYIMAFELMKRANERGYEKFNAIAEVGFKPVNIARALREDLNVIFMYHEDTDESGVSKIKTIGRMVDNVINLEGMFTVVLHTDVSRNEDGTILYKFKTNSDESCTAKSPMDMFSSELVDNDLQEILQTIDKYYS